MKKSDKISEIPKSKISEEIKNKIEQLKNDGVPSLPQDVVNMIMDYYKIDILNMVISPTKKRLWNSAKQYSLIQLL